MFEEVTAFPLLVREADDLKVAQSRHVGAGESVPKKFQSPRSGRQNSVFSSRVFRSVCRPFHGLGFRSPRDPTDESVGYCRSSALRTNALTSVRESVLVAPPVDPVSGNSAEFASRAHSPVFRCSAGTARGTCQSKVTSLPT